MDDPAGRETWIIRNADGAVAAQYGPMPTTIGAFACAGDLGDIGVCEGLDGLTPVAGAPAVVHTYHPDGRLATTTENGVVTEFRYQGPAIRARGRARSRRPR
ncbi:MAG: hypothetical protein U5R31_16720 [Acidimicrobiia bacterium]|nr:hypothetical protein [Acidimicrobiia bacterium]